MAIPIFLQKRQAVSGNAGFCAVARTSDPVAATRRGGKTPERVAGSRQEGLQRVSVIGVLDGLSDGARLVATFFFIRYQTIIASRREISLARQFSRVNLVNRMEINFARHCFGTGLFIIAVQENFRDMLAKSSEANPKRASVADSIYAT